MPLLLFCFLSYTALTEIYTLSLHDALPICRCANRIDDRRVDRSVRCAEGGRRDCGTRHRRAISSVPRPAIDRKSTRLNSSHLGISYAVFCLKKQTGQQWSSSAARRSNAACI